MEHSNAMFIFIIVIMLGCVFFDIIFVFTMFTGCTRLHIFYLSHSQLRWLWSLVHSLSLSDSSTFMQTRCNAMRAHTPHSLSREQQLNTKTYLGRPKGKMQTNEQQQQLHKRTGEQLQLQK